MNVPITEIGAGGVFALIVIEKVFNFVKGNNGKKKANGMCIDHEKRITGAEKEIESIGKNIEKIHKENREDHQKIFEKIDGLRK